MKAKFHTSGGTWELEGTKEEIAELMGTQENIGKELPVENAVLIQNPPRAKKELPELCAWGRICPRCGTSAKGAEQIEKLFGTRGKYAQSYCRVCRG
jgi:hypothetical protein